MVVCILIEKTTIKALDKLGNIVVETFVILDVSSNVSSLFAHPWKHCCGNIVAETKFASREAKMFPSEFRNI
jgi:hypothetical protein